MFDGQSLFSLVISGYWSWISQYLMVQTCQDPILGSQNPFSVIGCCCLFEPQNSNLSGLWTNQPTYLDWRIDLDSPFPAPEPSWAPAVVVGRPPRRLFGAVRHRAPCRWEAAPRASCSKEVLGWNMRIVEADLWVVIFRLNMSFHH